MAMSVIAAETILRSRTESLLHLTLDVDIEPAVFVSSSKAARGT